MEEDNVYKEIYLDLMKHHYKMLDEILGKDYYNYGCDVYSCNRFACEDVTQAYKSEVNKRKFWQVTACIISIGWAITALFF